MPSAKILDVMKILIVRHGETLLNTQKVHQSGDTPLSEIGLGQAAKIAERLQGTPIDKIYVSPLRRAYQTAEVIAQKTQVPLVVRKELEEIRRPSVLVGKSHHDPEVIAIKEQIHQNYAKTEWHHSDEENFADLKKRTIAILELLKEEDEESTVLLVTHGYVATMIGAYVLMGEVMTPDVFLHFFNHSEVSNTGLGAIEYSKTKGFKLLFWNDTTHY